MASFGERLKELRVKKNITQTKLGEILGVTLRMVQFLESGGREPTLQTITKLCEYFDVSADYLLGHIDLPITWTYLDKETMIEYIQEQLSKAWDENEIAKLMKMLEVAIKRKDPS